MKNKLDIVRRITVSLLLVSITSGPLLAATVDELAKKLVGRWEGVVDVKQNRGRTLVIQSIKKDGDQWSAEARYGTTGGGLARVKARVVANGDEMTLLFVSSANNPVTLQLINDKELNGTLTVFTSSQAGSNRSLKLTRVE